MFETAYTDTPKKSEPQVLVIDDDEVVRQLVCLHLRNNGYSVIEAEDAIVAGRAALSASIDLILCDVEMPYMNGYELVAALKADPVTQGIPVVFLTQDDTVADRAKALGAAAYLNKPVTADELLGVVARFVKPAN